MITIDKSKFNAKQLAAYEELVAIGKADVDPKAAEEEVVDDKPAFPPKKKPAKKAEEEEPVDEAKKSAMAPELKSAMEELANLKKSFDMKEMTEVAKKYAPLGKKEDELAQTLYEMKKSNPANYDAYIAILDESLSLVEKSGMFAEIGKSAGNSGNSGSVQSKVEAKAAEIMKSDSSIDYVTAIAKAWDDPTLAAEYDAEYFG